MKQETLTEALNISQQAVSKIEQSPAVEDDKLEQIAKVLGVSLEAIENYITTYKTTMMVLLFMQNQQ